MKTIGGIGESKRGHILQCNLRRITAGIHVRYAQRGVRNFTEYAVEASPDLATLPSNPVQDDGSNKENVSP